VTQMPLLARKQCHVVPSLAAGTLGPRRRFRRIADIFEIFRARFSHLLLVLCPAVERHSAKNRHPWVPQIALGWPRLLATWVWKRQSVIPP